MIAFLLTNSWNKILLSIFPLYLLENWRITFLSEEKNTQFFFSFLHLFMNVMCFKYCESFRTTDNKMRNIKKLLHIVHMSTIKNPWCFFQASSLSSHVSKHIRKWI